MSKQLTSVDTSSDTFFSWITKTNSIIAFCNTEVVTANNHANGATTTGTGYVIGKFGANTVVADVIQGGNTTAAGNLTFSTNVVFDYATVFEEGTTYGANSSVVDHGLQVGTSGTSVQTVDSFQVDTYRSAKYVISITDSVNSDYQITELILVHDGTNTYSTEYATIVTNTVLSTFATEVNDGSARLRATPTVSALTMHISKQLFKL